MTRQQQYHSMTTCLWATPPDNNNNKNENYDEEDFDLDTLQSRLQELRISILEQDVQRPPNPHLSPQQFISALLSALWNNADPLPDSGFRLLLRSSTPSWRKSVYRAVAAPSNANDDIVASAVGDAMTRPRNQFGLLVGEAERYVATFPTDVLDWGDGTCWVECRLREIETDELLAVTGWQLEQRPSDKSWLVAKIDWQDFRDEYRPGIGREEWERICG